MSLSSGLMIGGTLLSAGSQVSAGKTAAAQAKYQESVGRAMQPYYEAAAAMAITQAEEEAKGLEQAAWWYDHNAGMAELLGEFDQQAYEVDLLASREKYGAAVLEVKRAGGKVGAAQNVGYAKANVLLTGTPAQVMATTAARVTEDAALLFREGEREQRKIGLEKTYADFQVKHEATLNRFKAGQAREGADYTRELGKWNAYMAKVQGWGQYVGAQASAFESRTRSTASYLGAGTTLLTGLSGPAGSFKFGSSIGSKYSESGKLSY